MHSLRSFSPPRGRRDDKSSWDDSTAYQYPNYATFCLTPFNTELTLAAR